MLPHLRLKHVSFLIFTLMASIPVLVLALWVQESALDKELSSVKEKHLLVARNLTGDLERYTTDVENSFRLISNNLENNNDILGIPEYLDSLFLRHICLVDHNGKILKRVIAKSKLNIDSIKPEILSLLLPIMKIAKQSPESIHYSNLVRTGDNETTFFLVKSMRDDTFSIGTLSTTHIIQVQQKISFGRRGHAAIVDRTGRAIAHPIMEWVKTMKDMSFLPPVKMMMQGKTGVSKFFTPAMQAYMVAGYTFVSRTGWGVMIPQPFEELEERANDVRYIALIIALTGIAIAGAISWYMVGILTDPIQSVVDATELESGEGKSLLVRKVSAPRHFIPHELRILLSSFNLMRDNLNNLTTQLQSKIDFANIELKNQYRLLLKQSTALKETNSKLEKISCTDPLTEIYNRRYFNMSLEKELSYASRQNDTISLMMLDLDNFKRINDKYGHAAGDEVLRRVAKVVSDSVRSSDIVCRVGGEEFAVIFRHSDSYNISGASEKLRLKIQQEIIKHDEIEVPVTASIGVVTYSANSKNNYSVDELYRCSDMAMYHSKNNGRNQVTHFVDIADSLDSNLKVNG